MKKLWSMALVLILALFLTACSASNSTEAQEENNNDAASETNESTEAIENSEQTETVEEANEVSENDETKATYSMENMDLALVEIISSEWLNSGHANTDRPLNYAGGRDGCQPCHSGNGFQQYASDDPFTPQADAEAGEEAGHPSTMGCATCHTGVGKEMLLTGVTEGYVPFKKEAYDAGEETALCISCHNGRRDTGDIYEKWASGEGKPTSYPHYDSGALYSGEGGMEYPDVTYESTTRDGGCVSCHMPKTEMGYTSHTFKIAEADLKTDYTLDSNLRAEIDKLLEELHEAAVVAVDGAVEVGMSRKTFPFVDAEGNVVDLEKVSTEAFVAAYNYYLISDDKSGGVHNPDYTKSLLGESLKKLQSQNN